MIVLKYACLINKKIIFGFLTGSISSVILSYIPLIYSNIIDILLDNKNDDLKYILIKYLFLIISSNIFAGLRGYIFSIYMDDLTFKIKEDIIKSYNNKNLLYYYKYNHQTIANYLRTYFICPTYFIIHFINICQCIFMLFYLILFYFQSKEILDLLELA